MKIVKKGDKITVSYVGMLEDGTVFDSTEKHDSLLEFEAGSGELIKGFDDAVIGMGEGEEREVTVAARDAYGEHNPELIKQLPRQMFPDQQIQPGMVFMMNLQNGRQCPVRISDVSEDTITVDLNPPLAGKTLIFKIKIVSIAS